MCSPTKSRVYVLDTGETFTAKQLAEKLNMTATSARYRLNQSNISSWVLRDRNVALRHYKSTTFTLDNGFVGTVNEIAREYGVNVSTTYARLLRGLRDVESIAYKRKSRGLEDLSFVINKNESKSIKAERKTRMLYDEKRHWQLFAKCT